MTSVVSQEWLPQQAQAGSAGARVLGYTATQGVGAVAANEPPVIGDHRPELDARHAMGAADGQDCVGQSWHRTAPRMSKVASTILSAPTP